MNKRDCLALILALLLPSIAVAAPVKRTEMLGDAKQQIKPLDSTVYSRLWTTPVSITETGSTAIIKFEEYDGSVSTWRLKRKGTKYIKWIKKKAPTPPRRYGYTSCKSEEYLQLNLKGPKNYVSGMWRMTCQHPWGSNTGYNAMLIYLPR